MTTGNALTIEEQIEYMQSIVATSMLPTHMPKSILASLEKLAALESQPVPVEPYGFSHIRQCYNDDRKIALSHFERDAIEYIDTLQSALKLAQEERDLHYNRIAGLLFSGRLDALTGEDVRRFEKEYVDYKSLNRRMVEQYRDLVVAADAVIARWDTPTWKDAEPTARTINAMREALAKLDES